MTSQPPSSELTPTEHAQTRTEVVWSIFQSAPIGASILNEHGEFLRANEALANFLGYSVEEITELRFEDVTENSEKESYIALFKEVVDGQREEFATEMRYRHKQGHWKWGNPVYVALIGESEEETLLISLVVDITDKKQYAQLLQQRAKLAAIGQFASGIVHDFNNLLSIIVSYCDVIEASIEHDHHLHDAVEKIQDAAERGISLIRRIQFYTYPHMGDVEPVDLNAVVRETQELLTSIISKDIEIDVNLASSLAPIKSDSSSLTQIIINLVINARDAMPEGGKIVIETRPITVSPGSSQATEITPGDYGCLCVRDEGEGIAPEIQSKIFDAFFSTKDKSEGTGLGLFVVNDIVREGHGYIRVNSAINQGTEMCIYFPYY